MTSSVTIRPRLTETFASVTVSSTVDTNETRLVSSIIDARMLAHNR